MYIATLAITNFRCFNQTTVEFQPGINVILGENNAGKTALLCALRLVFDRSSRLRPDFPDFYQGIDDFTKAPTISVTATLRSSTADTIDDKALVATWLTKLDAPWEAQLTYEFFLPEEEVPAFTAALGTAADRDHFFLVLEQFIPKYVARIFAGLPENRLVAEPDALAKFDCHTVDAIRDVESELFAGTNPLLRTMLRQVLDHDADEAEALNRRRNFRTLTQDARSNLTSRMNLDALFQLAKETGAADGGAPILRDAINEDDFIAALRLYIDRTPFTVPATHNGLGYNNLLYISLLLASLQFKASVPRRGRQNAVLFPLLLIEEPEAHLHPSLQYKLLKYIQKRISPEKTSRQVFLTTHSTHITAAAGLEPIIGLSLSEADGGVHVGYPARVFGKSKEGEASRNYVERYLDATKSNMLFAKGVIFVEGIAEQLLVPCLSECIGRPIETHHVAVIAVGGMTFKHFLPLFGGGEDESLRRYALRRRVACMVDADPARKTSKEARRKKCWPYALHCDNAIYEYFPVSGVVSNLQTMRDRSPANIKICVGSKTLEYDLALVNAQLTTLVTPSCEHEAELRALAETPTTVPASLQSLLAEDGCDTINTLAACPDVAPHRFATCYLLCTEAAKGEHALMLERQLRENAAKPDADRKLFVCPDYIKDAILWTCVFGNPEVPHA